MDMLNVIIGAAAGFVGGYVVKGQTSKAESVSSSGVSYASLYNEAQSDINTLKSDLRSRDAEIDELKQQIKSQTKKLRDYEERIDDKADDLDDLKKMIETLRRKNEELNDKVSDYQSLYTAAQQEIERLKANYGND